MLEDYRNLEGTYDKLVSIEMIEAVGHEFHDTFFKKCGDLLKPDGQMLLQAINIADQNYSAYTRGVDFIKRYIFPGGCLTSVTAMSDTLTRVTDMRVVNLEDIGPHYAETLRHWRERFLRRSSRSAAWASPTSSFACGTTTCAIAKVRSSSGLPVWCKCTLSARTLGRRR